MGLKITRHLLTDQQFAPISDNQTLEYEVDLFRLVGPGLNHVCCLVILGFKS